MNKLSSSTHQVVWVVEKAILFYEILFRSFIHKNSNLHAKKKGLFGSSSSFRNFYVTASFRFTAKLLAIHVPCGYHSERCQLS